MKKYVILSVVVIFLCLTNVQASLIGQWTFNEGAGVTCYDSSGQGNNGTIYNGASYVAGMGGSALAFDGSNDYVDFGNAPVFNITSAFSIEVWVKVFGINGEAMIFGKDTTLFGISYYTNGYAYFYGGTSGSNNLAVDIPEGDWLHLVGTSDAGQAGNNMKFYLNGQLVNSRVSMGNPDSVPNERVQAAADRIYSTFVNCILDEARLYNHVLSEDTVASNYSSGPSIVPEPTTVALLTVGLLSSLVRKRR